MLLSCLLVFLPLLGLCTSVKIVTFLDSTYKVLLLNFICNLKYLNLESNLHVYMADSGLNHILDAHHISYTVIPTKASTSEKSSDFGEKRYWYISKQKTKAFLQAAQSFGEFVFSDVDVLWVRDPLPHFESYCKGADMYYQGDSVHKQYTSNSGFFFVRKSDRSVAFFTAVEALSAARTFAQKCDQDIVNDVLNTTEYHNTFKYLDLNKFPNGIYKNFWKRFNINTLPNDTFVLHNNWIISEKEKIKRQKDFGGWFLNANSTTCAAAAEYAAYKRAV